MIEPFVLDGPIGRPWWRPLWDLDGALGRRDTARARAIYAELVRALVRDRAADLPAALADAILFGDGTWAELVAARGADRKSLPGGVTAGTEADIAAYARVCARDLERETRELVRDTVPALRELADGARGSAAEAARTRLARALRAGDLSGAYGALTRAADELGAGPLARFEAYAWERDRLEGIEVPASADLGSLVGLGDRLERLVENVEAFLSDRPALATLLYGPRGSGKSTAVRALLPRYRERGLRLVELPGDALAALPVVLAALRRRPHHHVLYLDDLGVDEDDGRLRPLKSLLDGSLRARPPRVLVIATSNRRHLLRERFRDRPAPDDDDVHAWDTHDERLALADRFGLTITFPGADRRAYLEIVRSLAEREGIEVDGPALEDRALRFASWGNGLSGRTARQFVDTLVRARAEDPHRPDRPSPGRQAPRRVRR